jgi:hypothetical protein
MRSPYCTKVELRSALERRVREGTCVIPIIAETCDWEAMPIFKIAALPKDRANDLRPLNKWRGDRDIALTQIAQQVRRNVERIASTQPTALQGENKSEDFPAFTQSAKSPIHSSSYAEHKTPDVVELNSVAELSSGPQRTQTLPLEPDLVGTTQLQQVVVESLEPGALIYRIIGSDKEYYLPAIQAKLVNQLLQKIVRGVRYDQSILRTLFNLLVPNELKSNLFSIKGTLLLLDQNSARYPWELLAGGGEGNGEPFAIQYKIVRRLRNACSARAVLCGKGAALVIGDPVTGAPFPELPGAQHEAKEVSDLLQKKGLQVSTLIAPFALDAVAALLSEEYQLLHFTGHGVIDYDFAGQ